MQPRILQVYPGGKYAVRGVSIGIPIGECFGLLGINVRGDCATVRLCDCATKLISCPPHTPPSHPTPRRARQGAGKSSCLNMLSGEFRPTSGEAFLEGLSLATDVHACRRKIGFCPQVRWPAWRDPALPRPGTVTTSGRLLPAV